jgi:hypothetical protein
MTEYADQHAHDVANMTAQERADYDRRMAELDERVRYYTRGLTMTQAVALVKALNESDFLLAKVRKS